MKPLLTLLALALVALGFSLFYASSLTPSPLLSVAGMLAVLFAGLSILLTLFWAKPAAAVSESGSVIKSTPERDGHLDELDAAAKARGLPGYRRILYALSEQTEAVREVHAHIGRRRLAHAVASAQAVISGVFPKAD